MKIQFRWVGLNKYFNEIQIQDGLTLDKVRNGHAWTFFSESFLIQHTFSRQNWNLRLSVTFTR